MVHTTCPTSKKHTSSLRPWVGPLHLHQPLVVWLVLLLDVATALVLATTTTDKKDSYSSLCVVGKNENRYVREWVEYHKCLGVGRIYMYDHNSTEPLLNQVDDFVKDGYVKYHPFSGLHTKYPEGFTSNLERFMTTIQGQAYKHCTTTYGHLHTFMGFIDLDEFVVLLDPSLKSINDLLRPYENYAGLILYWRLLGSSGHKVPPDDWVTRSYSKCLPLSHRYNTQFKSFVNTAFQPTMYSPHRATFAVNNTFAHLVTEEYEPVASGRHRNTTHVRAAIYHYVIKSKADFEQKMSRGGGAGVTRPRSYMTTLDKLSTQTCIEAIQTYERLCGPSAATGRSQGLKRGTVTYIDVPKAAYRQHIKNYDM